MRAAEWFAALLGATVCIAGAIVTAKGQLETFTPGVSPLQALWPLPALASIDWAVLGLLGFGAVALAMSTGGGFGARSPGRSVALCSSS